MRPDSRIKIAHIFNSDGEDDVLQSLDDTEMVDAVLEGLEGDSMNVEEDVVEKGRLYESNVNRGTIKMFVVDETDSRRDWNYI